MWHRRPVAPSDEQLIARVGVTSADDRKAIDRGPALLPLLDAVVADATVPMPRRMAATRVANEIRVRSLDAPPHVPPQAPPAGEARAYFSAGGQLASDGFHAQHAPLVFVDALYAAGATEVRVERSSLVAVLPLDTAARARLFAIYNGQVDEFGEEFGGEETAGHEMTEAEAIAIGHPEAAGEWVVDDLHVTDTGQATLTFWWD